MEMCQCREGVCELSPSVSDRLAFPQCVSVSCDKQSWISSSFIGPWSVAKSESSRRDEPGVQKSSSGCVCLRKTRRCFGGSFSPVSRRSQKVSPVLGFNFTSSSVLSRYLIFLAVLLLRAVVVEGSPVHKVRHHHIKPEDLPHCSQRFRRDIQSMSLKESETAGLCPSWACLDIDERRRPVHITRVFCLQSSNSTCSALGGDFHCTQLHAQVEVWQEEGKPRDGAELTELWTADNKTRAMVPTKIKVEHGCLCASKKAKPAINPINMVT